MSKILEKRIGIESFFIFEILNLILDNFLAGRCIVEVITELFTPILCHISYEMSNMSYNDGNI